MTALRRLLPPGAAVDCQSDAPDSRRSGQSAEVRQSARIALAELGAPESELPRGRGGEPLWPVGFVGSLSHCPGLRAAAVAHRWAVRSIGIDVELNRPVRRSVLATILTGNEEAMVQNLASEHRSIAWSAVLWSAKESIFKAWYPLTGLWRDYSQCEVSIGVTGGSFDGRVLNPGANKHFEFSGRWAVSGPHVLTAVAVPPPVSSRF